MMVSVLFIFSWNQPLPSSIYITQDVPSILRDGRAPMLSQKCVIPKRGNERGGGAAEEEIKQDRWTVLEHWVWAANSTGRMQLGLCKRLHRKSGMLIILKAGVAKIKQTSKQTPKPFLKYIKPINVSTTKGNYRKTKNLLPQNSLEKLWLSSALSEPFSVPFDSPFQEERMNFRQKIIPAEQRMSSVKLLFLHWESDTVTNPRLESWALHR